MLDRRENGLLCLFYPCSGLVSLLTVFVKGMQWLPSKLIKGATFGPPAKRHSNGVSLVGRKWPEITCWLSECKRARLETEESLFEHHRMHCVVS